MVPNALRATSTSHKAGVEGGATCSLTFDGAIGWQITDSRASGLAHSMRPMFHLMDRPGEHGNVWSGMRRNVVPSCSELRASRTSGRAPQGERHLESAADPIVLQPDIRRLLLSARAFAEGARTLGLNMAMLQSEAESLGHPQAQGIIDLKTPILTAYFTDKGFQARTNCLQVLGRHDYIRDYGIG